MVHRILAVLLFVVMAWSSTSAEDGGTATSAAAAAAAGTASAGAAGNDSGNGPVLAEPDFSQPWKITSGQIKAWLRTDEQGHYLKTQLRKVAKKAWTLEDLTKIFGPPLDSEGALHSYDWRPTDEHPNGIVVVEDSKVAGYPTGQLYYLAAHETTVTGAPSGEVYLSIVFYKLAKPAP